MALFAPAAAASEIGVSLEAGVPDGATASVVVSPLSMARVHAGVGYNGIGPGIRAGAAYVPLSWGISPAVTVEAGRYFEGDAGPLARQLTGDPSLSNSTLERVGYDYAAARVGLEIGRGVTRVYLHAGMSYLRGRVRGAKEAFAGDASDEPRLEIRDDPEIRALVPSARAGFSFHF